jgi:allantoin racemase
MHQSATFLAENLPIPVLNPGQVAYKHLEMLIGLGLTHSKKAFPSPEVGKDTEIRKGWP